MVKKMITGSEALMQALIHEGVDTVFGYPGGSIMPVFDAMFDHQNDFKQVLVRHEQGAAHAAQGYARSSGKVGVCIVTSGPGRPLPAIWKARATAQAMSSGRRT